MGRAWTKEDWFEFYAQNLDALKRHPGMKMVPDVNNVFVCPLCFRFFTKDKLNLLSLEHVPQKSLGGHVWTLTCKECNNCAGRELNSDLLTSRHIQEFGEGVEGSSVEASVTHNDVVNLPATISWKNGNMWISYDLRRCDPKEAEKVKQPNSDENSKSIRFEYWKHNRSASGFRIRNRNAALLWTGYLWAFGFFGYGFIIRPEMFVIRNQIQNIKEDVISEHSVLQLDETLSDQFLGVNLITDPKELRAFLVIFDLETHLSRKRYGVVLPGFSEPGLKVYDCLAEQEASTNIPLEITHISDEWRRAILDNPDLCWVSFEKWQRVIKN